MKDDYGIYILYDCVLEDLKGLEDELLRVGSHFIQKHEELVDTERQRAKPTIDRLALL